MPSLGPRALEVLEALEGWRTEALESFYDIEADMVPSRGLALFGRLTDQLTTWCDAETNIDPTPLWEMYCRVHAWRRPGAFAGPRCPADVVEADLRRAMGLCERIYNLLLYRAQAGHGQTAEVPWDPKDPDYESATALLKRPDFEDLNLDVLRRRLKPDGPIRYMCNGRRRKVHLADALRAKEFLLGKRELPAEELFVRIDEYMKGVEERKAAIRQRKARKPT